MYKFALWDENEDMKEYSFPFNCTREEFAAWEDTQNYSTLDSGKVNANHYEDFISEMESEYGVFDAGGRVMYEEGYHSYEIESDLYPEVLEKCRQYFISNRLVDA